jgi:trehalose 6-phosphate synthase
MHFFRLRLMAALLLGITLISVASTYFEVLAHKHALRGDLERKTQWFIADLQPQLEEQFRIGSKDAWPKVLDRLRQRADQPSLAVFDDQGELLASAGEIPASKNLPTGILNRILVTGKESNLFARIPENPGQAGTSVNRGSNQGWAPPAHLWYEVVTPLRNNERTVGVLLTLVNADYIRAEGIEVWRRSFLRIAALVVLVVVVTLLMVHWFLQRPIKRAAEWLRRVRHGEAEIAEGARDFYFLLPLAKEVTSLAESLSRARAAAESEARLRDAAKDVWTADRLAVHARERLGDGKLFVVSNREPYMHVRNGKDTECIVPPSGLVTAIEPILQACDGMWIAHGSGSEDAVFVDDHDRLRVPPGEMRYTLRRVWLSAEEESGYYEGFSNEGLWPLCHIAHTRPIFRASDWKCYQNVNRKFGEALLEEMRGTEHPVVFVQDYHFALLPKIIKHSRPDARVAIFWHIPWPNAEAFAICPWQAELIDGLAASDVIGFHLQSHCNNFLDTVDHVLEARTDWEHFSIERKGHHCAVRPYPISVAWDKHEDEREDAHEDEHKADATSLLNSGQSTEGNSAVGDNRIITASGSIMSQATEKEPAMVSRGELDRVNFQTYRELGIEGAKLLLGVDRMDYTKGIVERLLAIEHLLEENPWYLEQISFVQIASPSRTRIPTYVALRLQVEEEVERINRRFQSSRWKPIRLIQRQCSHDEVTCFYRAADICLVTSLHDGMNLVAKEYLAARSDCDGVLVLSRFAGSAQELRDALIVNPYDVEQVSAALCAGLQMSRGERRLRMERMRRQVKEHNVYRWASNILTDLCAVRLEDELLTAEPYRSEPYSPGRKLA